MVISASEYAVSMVNFSWRRFMSFKTAGVTAFARAVEAVAAPAGVATAAVLCDAHACMANTSPVAKMQAMNGR